MFQQLLFFYLKLIAAITVAVLLTVCASAQVTTPIYGDTIKLESRNGNTNLIIENSTRDTAGFLYNIGKGKTMFKRALKKLNDTTYLIGPDTLKIHAGTGSETDPFWHSDSSNYYKKNVADARFYPFNANPLNYLRGAHAGYELINVDDSTLMADTVISRNYVRQYVSTYYYPLLSNPYHYLRGVYAGYELQKINDSTLAADTSIARSYVRDYVDAHSFTGAYAALTDVSLTALSNGQLTRYNSTSGKWENFTPSYQAQLNGTGYIKQSGTSSSYISQIPLATDVTGLLPLANGGNNNATFTSGYLNYFDGASIVSSGVYWDATNGRLGIGTASPSTKLNVIAAGNNQVRIGYDASNYTTFDVGTTGTLTISPIGSFVVTSSATISGNIQNNGTGQNSTLWVTNATGVNSSTLSNYLFAGASTINNRFGIRPSGNASVAVGASYATLEVGGASATIAASGTHALFANEVIKTLNITAGAGALTNAANLYVEAAPTAASNNYSAWFAGLIRSDGGLQLASPTASLASAIFPSSGSNYTGTTSGATWQYNNHLWTYLNGAATQLDNQVNGGVTAIQGGVIYGATTTSYSSTAAGTPGQFLTSNGTAAPSWAGLPSKTPVALTDAATVSWNYTTGYNATVTLGGNRTLSITNVASGDYGTVVVTQDATGSRTLTLPTGSKVIGFWGSGTSINLSVAPGSIDILNFVLIGSTYYWSLGKNYQ